MMWYWTNFSKIISVTSKFDLTQISFYSLKFNNTIMRTNEMTNELNKSLIECNMKWICTNDSIKIGKTP